MKSIAHLQISNRATLVVGSLVRPALSGSAHVWAALLSLCLAFSSQQAAADATVIAPDTTWTYGNQNAWPGACPKNPPPQQSPISFNGVTTGKATATWSISIPAAAPVTMLVDKPHYQVVFNLVAPLPTITVTENGGTTKIYELVDFHFHLPAEHASGEKAALEMHVRTRPKGTTTINTIFATLFVIGATATPAIDQVSAMMAGTSRTGKIDLGSMLKNFGNGPFYSYQGSLTTPECNSGVQWYVLQSPMSVQAPQFVKVLLALVGHGFFENARNEQTLDATAAKITLMNGPK